MKYLERVNFENTKKFELKKIIAEVIKDSLSIQLIFIGWKNLELKATARMIKSHYPELSSRVDTIMRIKA